MSGRLILVVTFMFSEPVNDTVNNLSEKEILILKLITQSKTAIIFKNTIYYSNYTYNNTCIF